MPNIIEFYQFQAAMRHAAKLLLAYLVHIGRYARIFTWAKAAAQNEVTSR